VHAAPQLSVLDADVRCSAQEAHRMLRNEPPFKPLRLRQLLVSCRASALHDDGSSASALEFAADVAAHTSLDQLIIADARCFGVAPAAMDAFVDAAMRLRVLEFSRCALMPASAASLTRLLRGGALSKLRVDNCGVRFMDAPSAEMLSAALRDNRSLTSLELHSVDLWGDSAAATALLDALTGHCSLRELCLSGDVAAAEPHAPQQLACNALGRLLAANSPALQELTLQGLRCGDAAACLGPLFDALPQNVHLRMLFCSSNNCSETFLHQRVLPAVRANGSLRALLLALGTEQGLAAVAAREAEALVRSRLFC
jgi:hypothetical protein